MLFALLIACEEPEATSPEAVPTLITSTAACFDGRAYFGLPPEARLVSASWCLEADDGLDGIVTLCTSTPANTYPSRSDAFTEKIGADVPADELLAEVTDCPTDGWVEYDYLVP
jgi:hypothetical protein